MSSPSTPAHLFLIGYRGSGKTTLARKLATQLGLPVVDTDELVETHACKTIAQIFSEAGESDFRNRESEAIAKVVSRNTPHIVSLGGGAILREANRTLILSSGWTAWLTASPEKLAQRIAGDPLTQQNRPALSKLGVLEEISTILEKRAPYYSATATAIYNTDEMALEQLAAQVACDYEHWVRHRSDAS
ncbi:MAG: shikimate kinase [Pirellula sp.]|nr:shikimate kinase [Pirellula sp.]